MTSIPSSIQPANVATSVDRSLTVSRVIHALSPASTLCRSCDPLILPATFSLLLLCCWKNEWITTSTQGRGRRRSEEHTSELQSHLNLVCRLLLEKKKVICMRVSNPPMQLYAHPSVTDI